MAGVVNVEDIISLCPLPREREQSNTKLLCAPSQPETLTSPRIKNISRIIPGFAAGIS
jgi:hypothetical protein